MKSTTKENINTYGFPCLMKSPKWDMIVLGTSQDIDGVITGTCVYDDTKSTHTPNRLGEQSNVWCRSFVPYDGSVTLEN